MKWKPKFLSQSGFTLVEVLIAAAALGGLALVATQLTSDVDKTKKHFEVSTEITQIKTAISSMLAGNASCKNTFLNLDVTNANTITHIRDGGNNSRYTSDSAQTHFPLYNNKIHITQMRTTAATLSDVPPGRMGKMDLEITFHKVNTIDDANPRLRTFKGGQNIVERIPIAIATDMSDRITDCFTDLVSVHQTMCEKLGGTYTAGTATCDLKSYPGVGVGLAGNDTVDELDVEVPSQRIAVSERYLAQFLNDLDRRYVNANTGGGGALETLADTANTLTIGDDSVNDIVHFNSKVGIGTAAPDTRLHVAGGNGREAQIVVGSTLLNSFTTRVGIQVGSAGSISEVMVGMDSGRYMNMAWDPVGQAGGISTSGAYNMNLQVFGGNLGVGALTPSYKLDVQGNARATAFETNSDKRFKKNVHLISDPVEKILGLRGVTFDWKTEEFPERKLPTKKTYGFIAQELEKVLPELVSTDNTGYKSIQYQNLTSVLVEAFKEAWAKIKDVANKLADLDDKTDKLAKENQKLEKRVKELEANHRALAEENKAIKDLICADVDKKSKKSKICK